MSVVLKFFQRIFIKIRKLLPYFFSIFLYQLFQAQVLLVKVQHVGHSGPGRNHAQSLPLIRQIEGHLRELFSFQILQQKKLIFKIQWRNSIPI